MATVARFVTYKHKTAVIYLDNNSTTQCAQEVVTAMLPFFSINYANSSSSHSFGKSARGAVDKAREDLATWLDCSSAEICFTSGATESNNLAIRGIKADGLRNQIVTSSIEHKSVLESCAQVERSHFQVKYLPVDASGRISLEAANKIIDEKTLLVSIHAANNEVGTIQPVQALAKVAHHAGCAVSLRCNSGSGQNPIFTCRRRCGLCVIQWTQNIWAKRYWDIVCSKRSRS